MEQFRQIIDTYFLNYDLYEKEKISFECDYGELIFLKSDNKDDLILYAIYISPQYRQNGLCRNILHYLIDKISMTDKISSSTKFKNLSVQTVLSKVLYEYLLRFSYKGKKFKNKKGGFVYKIK
jgi:hypothetical protein